MDDIKDRIQRMEVDIDKMKHQLSQCRRVDQIKDHDKLLEAQLKLKNIEQALAEFKQEHKELHLSMKKDSTIFDEKIEDIGGNLNQIAIHVKDLQKLENTKSHFKQVVITGIITTVVAGLILYIIQKDIPTDKAYMKNQTKIIKLLEFIKKNNEK